MNKKHILAAAAVFLILTLLTGVCAAAQVQETSRLESVFSETEAELLKFGGDDKTADQESVQLLEINRLEDNGNNSSKGGNNSKTKDECVAYLTFDDGPSRNTEKVLDILKEYGVPATFFVIGEDTPFAYRMYRRIVQEGHAIGNHTYTHNYSEIYKSPKAFMEDFYRLEKLLEKVVGVKPDIMRFPGGSRSASAQNTAGYDVIHYIIRILRANGYQYFDWNVSSGDAFVPAADKEQIIKNVLNGAKNRKEIVVLFHDTNPKDPTVETLPEIIERLKNMGYRFEILTKDGFCVQFAR